MPRGGKRPGAGRKPKAEKYAPKINKAEKRIADKLPALVDNLFALADGGYERIEERYEPAGLVLIDSHEVDGDGRVTRTKTRAYPDLDPATLVLVERKVVTADRDRAANIYLMDRILGKPTEHVEQQVTGADGGAFVIEIVRRADSQH